MKTKFFMIGMLALGMLTLMSCSDDDNYTPEDIYLQAFQQKYPQASPVEWEDKHGYKVADFRLDGKEAEAWFDKSAKWLMTETDLRPADLPAAVKAAFDATEYASWHIDDIDRVEKENATTIYVIEVEKEKQEYDLYFSEDGTFLKAIPSEGNAEHLPLTVSQKVLDKIRQLYPNATTILEFEKEGKYLEIEIKDGNLYKEIYFDEKEEWVYTQWEIKRADVPEAVMNGFRSSSYKDYEIDDIDKIHKPDGTFYLFELEDGEKDIYYLFNEEGVLVDSI